MSKMPLFFIIVVAIIVIAASFRFVQQRREKARCAADAKARGGDEQA